MLLLKVSWRSVLPLVICTCIIRQRNPSTSNFPLQPWRIVMRKLQLFYGMNDWINLVINFNAEKAHLSSSVWEKERSDCITCFGLWGSPGIVMWNPSVLQPHSLSFSIHTTHFTTTVKIAKIRYVTSFPFTCIHTVLLLLLYNIFLDYSY